MQESSSRSSVEELVHLYQDGAFSRRELMLRVRRLTGSAAKASAAIALFGAIESTASAESADPVCGCPDDVRVPADAADLDSQDVQFPGAASTLLGYLSKRRDVTDPQPGVLVIHENRGLTDHIKDVTRRVARAGYVALGLDLLSRVGGTSQYLDPVQATSAYNSLSAAARLEDMLSNLSYLKGLDSVRGDRLSAVGFCAGGSNCFQLAVSSADIGAAAVYYGAPPAQIDQLDNLAGPVAGFYAQLDRGTTSRVPPLLTALLDKNKPFALHVYQGVGHAFHNDTGPAYDRTAACDAWGKTLALFDRQLRRPS